MTDQTKILVVEDNDFVRMQIVSFLKEENYEVFEATDGKQALQSVADDESIEMAIVDVRMEPIDGFEFLRTIRIYDNNMPVILVTGDNDPDLLNEASHLGVAAVLMKPVQRDRLVKTVLRTLQHKARSK